MPFTVEDGSGLESANAYVSVAFADTYHNDRGQGAWAGLGTVRKEQCIVRATDYVDKRFGRKFRGTRQNKDQALEWPRFDAYDNDHYLLSDSDEIPRNLQKAIAEYALRASLYGELAPDPIPIVPHQDLATPDSAEPEEEHVGGIVSRISQKVDVIEETKSFMTPVQLASAGKNKAPISSVVTESFIPEYPAADMLIEELLRGGNRRLARG